MTDVRLMAKAADGLAEIVRDIKPDRLGDPTPCGEYDVRKLINHLLFWGPSLEGAARKETVPPPAAAETEMDLTGGDWSAALLAQVERIAAAWGQPAAWEGSTHMGGPTEMPAALVGAMIVTELVVHGWDLARATGQERSWDDEVVGYLLDRVGTFAEQGRQLGVFGPVVPVPDTAPALDRVLGITGRDPGWAAAR
ncbi:TIGR03086 family metal-binding protein [Micromonospora sp. HM5-17]|uniref:TIGR03086 family metal-binding protein n=1 Tax=Micromonospora sp. HM5-17 TaxID=2487710 RepID=UPI000F48D6D3|nr:TIGR03086 family metal-binding protein [Micromonospora sp. HM5-17]ROT31741.1 TIGR03086 family protein [Micromonospora sp. HM5-17]